jgi:uncharacterized protein involved in exopolysaccharide biosynthesis
MSVKNNSQKVDDLSQTQQNQARKIADIKGRISTLSDDIHSIKNDINVFKRAISEDIKRVLESLNANR